MSDIDTAVIETITSIARMRTEGRPAVVRSERLREDVGLDSLDLAQLVAELEIRLGVDPFRNHAVGQVLTVGDVIDVYAKAR